MADFAIPPRVDEQHGQEAGDERWVCPYDWRRPTAERWKRRSWNSEDERVVTPKSFGWGYGVNFRSLLRRLTGR